MPLTKIRLSHSTRESLLQRCDRLFAIEKIYRGERVKEENQWFSRGHAFGKGVQIYLLTGNMDLAIYHCWLDYWPIIEEGIKVTQHRTIHALLCAQGELDKVRAEWEIMSYNGMPAIELGVKVIIDDTYYYVGFLDAALKHRVSGRYATLEVKYTGSKLADVSPMYKYSGQGTGYSIVLDNITAGRNDADYDTIYFVCQDYNDKPKEIKFHTIPFERSADDRLKWFISLGLDVEHIKRMRELKLFPQRGSGCVHFGRVCKHFGTCNMHGFDEERDDEPDPHEADYQFVVKLDELIAANLNR
jgi:hypothetical protein